MTRAREHLILCGNLGRNYGQTWSDNLFPQLGLLEAPSEPEMLTLMGGLHARVAPLAHYIHTPLSGLPGSAMTARRQAEARADRLAEAILSGQPLESVL
jgi:hypothetical protein